MKTLYRQGIVDVQKSPIFLNLFGGDVQINANDKPTIVSFAYGDDDYLFSEEEDIIAWNGPFSGLLDYWLYWDLDLYTSQRTFGYTNLEPQVLNELPSSASNNQHVFLTTQNKMKVKQGSRWVDKLRVFAAKLSGSNLTTLTGEPIDGNMDFNELLRSQVGLNMSRDAGFILLDDDGLPVKRTNSERFLTTESTFVTQKSGNNEIKFSAIQYTGVAAEPIPKYHGVAWHRRPNKLTVAAYDEKDKPCAGIAIEDITKDNTGKFIVTGVIEDILHFDWQEDENTPLFLGTNGELTTTPTRTHSIQRVGHIINRTTIFVDIKQRVLIDLNGDLGWL